MVMSMKDGIYFLCPKCKRLYRHFKEVSKEIMDYYYELKETSYGFEYEIVGEKMVHSEFMMTECPNPDCDFYSEAYDCEEFAVKIENGKIKPIGDFWDDEKELFNKIVREMYKNGGIEKYIVE